MAVRSYRMLGVELAPYVIDWGSVEQVKDILLAQAQLFTSEHTLVVSNEDGRFSKDRTGSMLYGRNLQTLAVELSLDGELLYQGLVRKVTLDHAARTAAIVTQNAFTRPASTSIVLVDTGVNPAEAIRSILAQVGLAGVIDSVSFEAAAGSFSAAGVSVDLNFKEGDNVTALGAIQQISSFCSLSCFVRGGTIYLRNWIPYQGNFSGVRYPITPAEVYDFGSLGEAYSNMVNSLRISWGASGAFYLQDDQSIKDNGITTNSDLNGKTDAAVALTNQYDALYLGRLYLSRTSTMRRQGSFTGGRQLMALNIGDRISVAAPNWSTNPLAFEVIETHVDLNNLSVGVVCATL